MIIYDRLRVIDGDTIEIRLWPSGYLQSCRIEGLDTDELGTKRGKIQSNIASRHLRSRFFNPYIVCRFQRTPRGKRREYSFERWIVKVYFWRWWRYVNYAEWMKNNGHVKKGSKWND